jgi:uncharacterized protein (DUF58 family)
MLKRFLYLNFRHFYSINEWVRSRFTGGGLLVLAGLLVSAAVGVDTNRTMAHQIFTLLLFLIAFSFMWSWFLRPPRLTVRRNLPPFGTVGEALTYRVVIQNHSDKEQTGLSLVEKLVDPRPSFEEFVLTPEPGEASRNWFDRKVGYYRWQWLISRRQGAVIEEQALPPLPPRSEVEVRVETRPLKRGRLCFAGVTVAIPDPFGLVRSLVTFPCEQSLLALPKRYVLPPIDLPGTRKFQVGGVAMASKVGDSEEFVSLRDYRPGDPLRHIHWKSWAKLRKPIIKEFQEEFFVRHALIVDTFLDVEYSEAFEEVVSVASSFACSVQSQDSLLDLMFVGTEAHHFTSGRGLFPQDRIMEILASLRVCKDKPFSVLHHLVREHIISISSCICIFLSWDEQRQELVRDLRNFGVHVLILLVIGPDPFGFSDLGPMDDKPELFHRLEVGHVEEGLAAL